MAVHPIAAAGYTTADDEYERTRPDYPAPLLDALTTGLGLGRSSVVVELGAGTGKFTRLLASRVGALVATEPVAAMRSRLAAVQPLVVASTAENIPVSDGSVDAVVAATSFHWFDASAALAEAHRVLRPGGGLALVWNNPDRETDWVARVWSVVDTAQGAVPGNLDLGWRDAFISGGPFRLLGEHRFAHSTTLRRQHVAARVASISFVAALPTADRRALQDRVGSILAQHPQTAGRRLLRLPYRSDLHLWRRY